MSSVNSDRARMISQHVPYDANRYRWYILRYLRACVYPVSTTELSEYVSSQVGTSYDIVKKTIEERDLPILAECNVIKHDSESQLVCLQDDSFVDCSRRALRSGVISHLKPPRLHYFSDLDTEERNVLSASEND